MATSYRVDSGFSSCAKNSENSPIIWASVTYSRIAANYVIGLLVGVFIYAKLKIDTIGEIKRTDVWVQKFILHSPTFLPDTEQPNMLLELLRNITNLNGSRNCI